MPHASDIASSTTPGSPATPPAQPRRLALPGPDSLWWLAAVSAAFTILQLISFSLRTGLSWDEVVYVSQVSPHAHAAFFDPARSRGVPVLVAPVTLVTSSVAVLRGYLAVMSGLALFGSLLAWRRLRPAWMLALAGVMFGGLWVTLYYAPQAMPDEWMAFAALAAVGMFARLAGPLSGEHGIPSPGPRARRWLLAGLVAVLAAAGLMRIGDAMILAAVLAVAALALRPWRNWPLLAAIAGGAVLGAAEWVIEAYARFGGPLRRLHLAGAEQGGIGVHLSGMWAELRALNGPTLCRPCTIGWRYPELSLWWLAIPVLVVLGLLAARRAGRLSSALLAAVCAAAVGAPYLFGIDYAAPRFLLPSYALVAIPVADLLGAILITARATRRPAIIGVVAAGLALQVLSQLVVLTRQASGTANFHRDYTKIASELHALGVRPPCLVNGAQAIPVAFYAGCASTPEGRGSHRPSLTALGGSGRLVVLEWRHERPPAFAAGWQRTVLTGTGHLRLVAYLPPGG